MALYVYEKATLPPPPPAKPKKEKHPLKFSLLHLMPLLVSFTGIALIGFVVWPIISYELATTKPAQTTSGLLNPLVDEQSSIAYASTPAVVGQLDFTQANNWFPTSNLNLSSGSQGQKNYTISIPKLKIENAVVRTDTMDLSQALIHYPDTANPGDLGSPVIFGHSILPQFYNPKNYMSIFSLLPQLEPGDKIYVSYDSVQYTYQVAEKEEVYPTDLSPLEQQFDNKRLKLITCVPPGLKTRRLVVTAVLTKS